MGRRNVSSVAQRQLRQEDSTFERNAVVEEVIRRVEDAVEDSYSRTAQDTMAFSRKLLVIAHANVDAYFDWAREVIGATSPADFIGVSIKSTQQHFEASSRQTRELVQLAQKAAIESMGPLGNMTGNILLGRPDLT